MTARGSLALGGWTFTGRPTPRVHVAEAVGRNRAATGAHRGCLTDVEPSPAAGLCFDSAAAWQGTVQGVHLLYCRSHHAVCWGCDGRVSRSNLACAVTGKSVRPHGLRKTQVKKGVLPSDCTVSGPLARCSSGTRARTTKFLARRPVPAPIRLPGGEWEADARPGGPCTRRPCGIRSP